MCSFIHAELVFKVLVSTFRFIAEDIKTFLIPKTIPEILFKELLAAFKKPPLT
jgi:hypothetical protein